MSKRKRFNPLEEMQPGPEGSIGLHPVEIIAQNGSLGLESGKVERIERLKPGQMIPDRQTILRRRDRLLSGGPRMAAPGGKRSGLEDSSARVVGYGWIV
jgi:hypothetical protein